MLLRAASVALTLFVLMAGTVRADPPTGGPTPESARQPANGTGAPRPAAPRPKIGLVLSGGGARGLAHVGVLKVLERERIPVDVIAGTSMGAIIGGLYASGMKAEEIEQEILRIDWDRLFAQRVSRQQLSQRRKEEDFDIATALELGWRDGEFRAPQSAVSSRGLETLLRRMTLPVARLQSFDELPTPFRAIATDMETGGALVLDHGDLALALRSSMSVPGVFSATEWEGRILGDGGLVNNVPVDVARAMGADRLIVVNIGTPLAKRDSLTSALGLTAQMINILTEQNVQRSLASLGPQDLLLAPELGELSSGDFNRAADFITAGQAGAQAALARLVGLRLADGDYLAWQARRQPEAPPAPVLDYVRFEGSQGTHPERFAQQLQSQAGQPFEPDKAAADTRTLAASGDYLRTDYRLEQTERGQGLVLDLEDKPWGPNFLRVGLDLDTDFSGRSAFNIKLSHNRHWLTRTGTEWRNRVQIGEEPSLSTELYHPLNWTLGPANDWFLSLHGLLHRQTRSLYNNEGTTETGQVRRTRAQIGLDLGQPWGSFGEFRLGVLQRGERVTPLVLSAGYTGSQGVDTWTETGLRLQVVIDQLDFANFPLNGYRVQGEAVLGRHREPERSRIGRLELQTTLARSWGPYTLNLHTEVQAAATPGTNSYGGGYALGGFQHLSGYRPGQIAGDAVFFSRLGAYTRLPNPPFFARGWFLGGTLEAGQAWDSPRQLRLRGLRGGGSLYLGADTGIGPMYLGLTYAPQGEPGVALMIGRP